MVLEIVLGIVALLLVPDCIVRIEEIVVVVFVYAQHIVIGVKD